MRTRHSGENEVTAQKCRIGTMLASLIEDFTRGPVASSSGCSMRAAICSTLRGEPGSIGPALPKLGYAFGAFAEISNACLLTIDVDRRYSMIDRGRLSMVGDRSVDRLTMVESSIIGGRRSSSMVDGRWSRIGAGW